MPLFFSSHTVLPTSPFLPLPWVRGRDPLRVYTLSSFRLGVSPPCKPELFSLSSQSPVLDFRAKQVCLPNEIPFFSLFPSNWAFLENERCFSLFSPSNPIEATFFQKKDPLLETRSKRRGLVGRRRAFLFFPRESPLFTSTIKVPFPAISRFLSPPRSTLFNSRTIPPFFQERAAFLSPFLEVRIVFFP